jgi:DNA-binding transcriptional regulator YdaS (Cro superfamily)
MDASTASPDGLSYSERDALADALGLNRRYLYQVLSGRRQMNPEEAVDVEQRSGGKLKRWMLRRHTWHRIWPELIATEGAPPVPSTPAPASQEAEVAHG